MIAPAKSLAASSARALPLRMRPDLQAAEHRYQGQVSWVLKDPLGMQFFRFREHEYSILKMLDGRTSLEQIQRRYEQRFKPEKMSLEALWVFVSSLHEGGLLISDAPGQGERLRKRRDERRRKELLGRLSNVLAIRFRGVNPDRLLDWLYPWVRWMFSPLVVLLCCGIGLGALTLVTVHFDVFRSRLPDFHQFFNLHNAMWLAVSLGLVKVVHEFGHGLTCKHYGGECHEMGVLILVLTPCLYCNASDSWMQASKWRRAAVAAAGIYVEVVIASLCTFLWWFTEPGFLNHLCLNLMFICSAGTVMFNANPLMKYDGYYVLSDLIEIPNLQQKSSRVLQQSLSRICLGIKPPQDRTLPQRQRALFASYAIAAALYRVLILFSILWFLITVLEPYHLEVLGKLLAVVIVGLMLGKAAWKSYKFLEIPGKRDMIKALHVSATVGGLVVLGLVIGFVPLPHSVLAPLEIKAYAAAPVYVTEAGILEAILVSPGQQVEAGQLLARLVNPDLEQQLAKLKGQRDVTAVQLQALERQQFNSAEAVVHLQHVRKTLESLDEQLQSQHARREQLYLRAPCAGSVLSPPERPNPPGDDDQLPSWTRTPLEPQNRGCLLETGVLFCQVGDPQEMEAVLVVDQADIDLVAPDAPVEIRLNKFRAFDLEGRIECISTEEMKVSSQRLSTKSGGELATRTDGQGAERPQSAVYQARVRLTDTSEALSLGLRGRAKIHTRSQTLAQRCSRFVYRTFRFRS